MHAKQGDQIVIDTTTLDALRRHGEVIEVIGQGEREHYRIRWQDGHVRLRFPGAQARLLAVDFFHVDCAITLKLIYVSSPWKSPPLRAHPRGDQPSDRTLDHPEARNLLMDLDDHAATFWFLVRDRAASSPRRSTPCWPAPGSTP